MRSVRDKRISNKHNCQQAASALAAVAALVLCCCCVPNRSFRAQQSVYQYHFPDDHRFFRNGCAGLAFIEFDDEGSLFHPEQVDHALDLVHQLQDLDREFNGKEAQGVAVFVFIHGWKNNASEASGNVWGFRKALDELAVSSDGRPIVGIYIGWPGIGWPGFDAGLLEDFSFGDRENVAGVVGGAGALTNVLEKILRGTKGPDYQGKSSCVLIGHSFGGLVMETAVTPLLRDQLAKLEAGGQTKPLADLIVLINEAAPALLARPLLYYLTDNHIEYSDPSGKTPFPLLLSMTSQGDVDTKFAFPGGQFLDHNKPTFPKDQPPDRFGITDKTYFYLTTANTIALQNHQFVSRPVSAEKPADGAFVSPRVGHTAYDLVPKPGNNRTPYWVTQLPQVFVPDHGTVFGVEFMRLLVELLDAPKIVTKQPSPARGGDYFCPAVAAGEPRAARAHALASSTTPRAPVTELKLKKKQ